MSKFINHNQNKTKQNKHLIFYLCHEEERQKTCTCFRKANLGIISVQSPDSKNTARHKGLTEVKGNQDQTVVCTGNPTLPGETGICHTLTTVFEQN